MASPRVYKAQAGFIVCLDGEIEVLDLPETTPEEVQELIQSMEIAAQYAPAGNAPHVAASGVSDESGTLTLTLTFDKAAEDVGNQILKVVRDTLEARKGYKTVRELRCLVSVFGEWILQIPDVHAFLDELFAAGNARHIREVLSAVDKDNPQRSILGRITAVARIRRKRGWTTRKAANEVSKAYRQSIDTLFHEFEKYGRLADLQGSRFVRGEKLMPDVWCWPAQ